MLNMKVAGRIGSKIKKLLSFLLESLRDLIYRGRHSRYQKFIILCNGRSGSNMLVSFLNSHPGIRCFSEVFHQHAPRLGFPYQAFFNEKTLRERRENDVDTFLKRYVFKSYQPGIKAVGFKLIYWHCEGAGWEKNILPVLESIEGLKIIHLIRRNKLDQYISEKVARENKNWIAKQESDIKPVNSMVLEPGELDGKIRKNIELEEKYGASLEGKQKITVYYEDLIAQGESTLHAIQTFLAVPEKRLKTQTIRQIQKTKHKLVENYPELKKTFQNTDLSVFFDE